MLGRCVPSCEGPQPATPPPSESITALEGQSVLQDDGHQAATHPPSNTSTTAGDQCARRDLEIQPPTQPRTTLQSDGANAPAQKKAKLSGGSVIDQMQVEARAWRESVAPSHSRKLISGNALLETRAWQVATLGYNRDIPETKRDSASPRSLKRKRAIGKPLR